MELARFKVARREVDRARAISQQFGIPVTETETAKGAAEAIRAWNAA